MNIFEELLSFKLTEALPKDKPKSTEKLESKTTKNLEMEPPTKSTADGAAIPMPWYTNMDDYHNNTNTASPTPSTTNADKINDGDGVKAPKKRGRPSSKKKSTPQAEEMSSPPQKKPSIEVNKGMEEEKRAISQSPSTMPTFYNNYAGHGFMPPQAYYGYPSKSWSPMLSAPPPPPSSPAPMMLSPSPFQHCKPIPVATSTPLNPAFECSTSSMMDAQKEARGDFYAGNEQSLMEQMWDTTAVGNTNMDLSNFCSWASNSMEDQSNDYERNGPTSSSEESSTVDPQLTMLMPMQKMPITLKPQCVTPHSIFYPPHPFGHPIQFPVHFTSYSSGHLPMPILQQNEVQHIIVKDNKNKQENSEDAKDGIYRNCLVCGENNKKCGKHTGTGLQICPGCRLFFKRVVESDADKKATFQCTQGSGNCLIRKETRNSCEFCRFQACLKAGMDRQKIVELKAKQENSEDAKDSNGLYRNCLVCGNNNKKCGYLQGKHTGTGLQVCDGCRHFFKRVVESSSDKKVTFQCSQGPGNCLISKDTPNSCEFCRFHACLKAGMDRQKTVELKAKRDLVMTVEELKKWKLAMDAKK